jgi:hypothetical protein
MGDIFVATTPAIKKLQEEGLLSKDKPESIKQPNIPIITEQPKTPKIKKPLTGSGGLVKEKTIKKEEQKDKPAEPKISLAEQYIKLYTEEEAKKSKRDEPILEEISKNFQTINEAITEQIKTADEELSRLETSYKAIKEEIDKPLPKPPVIEEVLKPKNWVEVITKVVTPAVIGIASVLHPGKYYFNYHYFNAFMDAMKKNDLELAKRAIEKWKMDYEYAREEKQNQLLALQTQLDEIKARVSLKDKKAQLTIAQTQNELNLRMELLKHSQHTFENIMKLNEKILELQLKETQFKEQMEFKKEQLKEQMELRKTMSATKAGEKEDKRYEQFMRNFYMLLDPTKSDFGAKFWSAKTNEEKVIRAMEIIKASSRMSGYELPEEYIDNLIYDAFTIHGITDIKPNQIKTIRKSLIVPRRTGVTGTW